MPVEADVSQWQKTAALLKTADKKIAAGIRKGLRKAVEPVSQVIGPEGAEKMPHRGGLSEYLAASVKPSVSLTGNSVAITLRGTSRRGKPTKMAALDEGQLRHPVYGHWRRGGAEQQVPAHAWSAVFLAHKDEMVPVVQGAIQNALANLEKGGD